MSIAACKIKENHSTPTITATIPLHKTLEPEYQMALTPKEENTRKGREAYWI
jgi:hypothetical protein